MGYLLMALLAVKQNGAAAIMFYLTIYALMDLGAFGILATLSEEEADLDDLDAFRGLAHSRPGQCTVLAICLVSLAGMPPTAGFIGKFALFQATIQAGYPVLAVIGILTVILAIYYYFKIIAAMFMHPVGAALAAPRLSLPDLIAGGLIFILLLLFGLVPEPVFEVIKTVLPAI
jgi:NADH-quinone oxidoreductase subunit N